MEGNQAHSRTLNIYSDIVVFLGPNLRVDGVVLDVIHGTGVFHGEGEADDKGT